MVIWRRQSIGRDVMQDIGLYAEACALLFSVCYECTDDPVIVCAWDVVVWTGKR